MLSRHRRILGLVLLAALAVVGWVYRDTFASIAQKWFDDAAFSHGFLILPIALWLAYQKRDELAAVAGERRRAAGPDAGGRRGGAGQAVMGVRKLDRRGA